MSFEKHAEEMDLKGLMVTMVISALGFLVALQWRDAIKLTIDTFLPGGEGIMYSYMVALVVTIAAAVVAFILMRIKNADIIPDRYESRVKNGVKRRAKKVVKRQK